MKNSKLIWAVGALFAIALIVGSAGIISAQQAWQAPGQAFPDQDVAPPIDTGSSFQTKAQGIGFDNSFTNLPALGLQQSQFIQAGGTTGQLFKLTPLDITGNSILQNLGGALNMNVKGLILPNFGISTLNATKGMITYDPSSNTVKLYNGTAWTDIGTGTGGDTFWKANGTSGIIYNGNSVTISNIASIKANGWYFTRTQETSAPSGASKMACDTSASNLECSNDYYSTTGNNGDVAYDQYPATCPVNDASDPSKNLSKGNRLISTANAKTCYNYKIFTYSKTTPGLNTASLNVGNLDAEHDVTLGGTLEAGLVQATRLEVPSIDFSTLSDTSGFPVYTIHNNNSTYTLTQTPNVRFRFYLVWDENANASGGPICGKDSGDRPLLCNAYGGAYCNLGNLRNGQESDCIGGTSGSCVAVCFGSK